MAFPKDFWVLRPEHVPIATYLGLSSNPEDWTIASLTQIAAAADWGDGIAFNRRITRETGTQETEVHALVDQILAVQTLL